MNKHEKCKNLIRHLIMRCEPPEFAQERYRKATYDKAKKEVLKEIGNQTHQSNLEMS